MKFLRAKKENLLIENYSKIFKNMVNVNKKISKQ